MHPGKVRVKMTEEKVEHPIITAVEGKYANQYWVLDRDEIVLGRDDRHANGANQQQADCEE